MSKLIGMSVPERGSGLSSTLLALCRREARQREKNQTMRPTKTMTADSTTSPSTTNFIEEDMFVRAEVDSLTEILRSMKSEDCKMGGEHFF